jgi:hypothetical protein
MMDFFQRPNAPQISRAHETLNKRLAQSAKTSFNKNQGWGVGYICLLAGFLPQGLLLPLLTAKNI